MGCTGVTRLVSGDWRAGSGEMPSVSMLTSDPRSQHIAEQLSHLQVGMCGA